VLPHTASNIIASSQIVTESLSLAVKNDTTFSSESFCSKEFYSVVGVIKMDQTSRVNLDVFEINGSSSNLTSHNDTITSAVLPVGGRKVHKVRAELL
jgi:hypothetical protein